MFKSQFASVMKKKVVAKDVIIKGVYCSWMQSDLCSFCLLLLGKQFQLSLI
jgi:hypothetical protein